MSAVAEKLLTPREYLAQERSAPFKSEYYRGEMFAMAGAKFEHCLVNDSLARHIGNQLADGPCRAISSNLRVKISATGLYTYPDIVVLCDKPEFEDDVLDTLLNPLALVEVLSESTEKYDRGAKFKNYRSIPSLKEFVLVAQDQALIERYVRQSDDNWLLTIFSEANGTFEFASIPVRIPMADVYRGVAFPEQSAG